MKNITAIALAITLGATAHAQVTTSERTVQTETNSNGAVRSTTEQRTETQVGSSAVVTAPAGTTVVQTAPAYWTRLESAYTHAGVPSADIARLRAIDTRVIETRRTNPNADLSPYYAEQTSILQPAQVTKVRTYLQDNRPVETLPAYAVTTYETVPTRAGLEINTPLGNIGVGVPTGSKVVEKTTVVPAQP